MTDFIEKSTREERQGLVFEGVPDADLFFVDKVGCASVVQGKQTSDLALVTWVSVSAA